MSDRFKYESLQDTESILAYLRSLVQAFEDGSMRISHRDKTLILKPQGLVTFNLEAKVSGEDRKLGLKFRWKERKESNETEEPLVLKSGNGDD